MAEVKHFKEDGGSPPTITVPNAIYFVKNGDVYDEYLTTKTNELLPVGNIGLINTLIAMASSGGSGSDTYTGVAGEILGGGKLVYLSAGKFYLYDASNEALADMAFGITKTAAIADASVDIQISGIYEEVGLGLTPDLEYYAGLTGLLTSSPNNVVITSIGIAITANKIKIEIQPSIITV